MAGTPLRSIRVPDDLWYAASCRAQAENRTMTSVLIHALEAYAAGETEPAIPEARDEAASTCERCGAPIDFLGERYVYCTCLHLNRR